MRGILNQFGIRHCVIPYDSYDIITSRISSASNGSRDMSNYQ